MIIPRIVLGWAWVFAVGYLLVTLLVGRLARGSPLWWFILSLVPGLGSGLASLNYFLWQVISPSRKRYFVLSEGLILLLLLGAALLRRGQKAALPSAPPAGRVRGGWGSALNLAFYTALVLAVLVFIVGASLTPLGTRDAWSIWNLSARYMFQGGENWTNAFSVYQYSPDYPLLLPASVARLWSYAGTNTPLGPISVGFAFTFATLGLLVAALKSLRGPALAWLGGLVLLAAPSFLMQGPSQVADMPLGYYFLAALALYTLYDSLPGMSRGWITLAGIAAGLAIWTKNEGWLFLAGLLAARLAASGWRKDWVGFFREAGAFLGGLAPVIAFVLYFKFAFAPSSVLVAGQGGSTLARLADGARYTAILGEVARQLVQLDARRSIPFLLLLVLLLLFGLETRRIQRKSLITGAVLLAFLLVGYFLAYLTTPLDLAWQLRTSLFRVALQVWPLAVFFITLLLRFAKPQDAKPIKAISPT